MSNTSHKKQPEEGQPKLYQRLKKKKYRDAYSAISWHVINYGHIQKDLNI